MARPLRMVFPGGTYHVIARGNERKDIYTVTMDKKVFLKQLADSCERFDCILLAYVLMDNHYHFIVRINKPNLSLFMRSINGGYATYYNRTYKRSGHLFQGRFYAALIEHGPELKRAVRYIHMNPVRARIVEQLPEYKWSSHSQYEGGRGKAEPEHVLKLFSENRIKAVEEYRKYMAEAEILDWDKEAMGIYGEYILGSEDFVKKVRLFFKEKKLSVDISRRTKIRKTYIAEEIIRNVSEFFEIRQEELLNKRGKWNEGKRVLIYLLSKDCGLSHSKISKLLDGLHYTGIGKIVQKVDEEAKRPEMKKRIERIRRGYTVEKIGSEILNSQLET